MLNRTLGLHSRYNMIIEICKNNRLSNEECLKV